MPCCFHAEFSGRVEFSYRVHEFEKTGVRIGKTNSLDDDFTSLVDDSSFVKTFGNVNTDYVHK